MSFRLLIMVATLLCVAAPTAGAHDNHDHSGVGHGATATDGSPGKAAQVQRTVRVTADDNAFDLKQIEVRAGETVRFMITNIGSNRHEFAIASPVENAEHRAMMRRMPTMKHDDPNVVTVDPGETKALIWRFGQDRDIEFSCNIENHAADGMRGAFRVIAPVAAPIAEPDHDHRAPPAPTHDHGASPMAVEHDAHMPALLGPYGMAREASGTSWQPDSTLVDGLHGQLGDWSTMLHGSVTGVYDRQGGPRGDDKGFSQSMLMGMATRPLGDGRLGLRGMVSLDPFMGKRGYPLLFQTGETADGRTGLVDRQHPHDAFMELATTYSLPVSPTGSVFAYLGLPGEPALGPPTFMHRFSGMGSPEAPLTHHWLDSTHITFGVVTLGTIQDRWKVEGSVFRGREPDQHRWDIEAPSLDSGSFRVSYNPTDDLALQVSYGRLTSPEQLHSGTDENRLIASASYNRRLAERANWQTTFAWGRRDHSPGRTLDGFLLESALLLDDRHTLFGRVERVSNDELFAAPDPRSDRVFTINKLSLGYLHDVRVADHLKLGAGALVSFYDVPKALDSAYGSDPVSFMLFMRAKLY